MDEIDWEALLGMMPTIVVVTDETAQQLAMKAHPSSNERPAFLSAAMN